MAAATMTPDGMTCSPCSIKTAALDVTLTSAAGSMPGKLLAVVIFMVISIVLSVLSFSFLSAAFSVALLIGLFIGNDGVRRFVIALTWLDLMLKIGLLILVLSMAGGQLDGVTIMLSSLSMSISGFVVWALVQNDVRDWMFKTAFKDGLAEL